MNNYYLAALFGYKDLLKKKALEKISSKEFLLSYNELFLLIEKLESSFCPLASHNKSNLLSLLSLKNIEPKDKNTFLLITYLDDIINTTIYEYQKKYGTKARTADIIIFYQKKDMIKVLTITRKNAPFKNQGALPGGFIDKDEKEITAALRELEEESSLEEKMISPLEFITTVSGEGRDPRCLVTSYVFSSLIKEEFLSFAKAKDDAKKGSINWLEVSSEGEIDESLSFDHNQLIKKAYLKLKQNNAFK